MAYVFDTNALIYAQKMGISLTPKRHHISVISELEILSFANLSLSDERQIQLMLGLFNNHSINLDIKSRTIALRRTYKLKLPDSIIVATAQALDCHLITEDKQILRTVSDIARPFESIIQANL